MKVFYEISGKIFFIEPGEVAHIFPSDLKGVYRIFILPEGIGLEEEMGKEMEILPWDEIPMDVPVAIGRISESGQKIDEILILPRDIEKYRRIIEGE